MTKPYSYEDLRSWGASLDREQPQGLGQVLMRYADFWQAEVEQLRDALRSIAHSDLRGTDLTVAGHIAHAYVGIARGALAKAEGKE